MVKFVNESIEDVLKPKDNLKEWYSSTAEGAYKMFEQICGKPLIEFHRKNQYIWIGTYRGNIKINDAKWFDTDTNFRVYDVIERFNDDTSIEIFDKSLEPKINLKFFNESIDNVLKPKSEEEVLNNMNIIPSKAFEMMRDFHKQFNKPVPEEKIPLILKIWDNMVELFNNDLDLIKKRDLGSFGAGLEFNANINNRKIWVVQNDSVDYVLFKINPFIKVKSLKDISTANNYLLQTYEQYEELVKYL